MQIIGVIDLKAGAAVHASGGERTRYAPVQSPRLGPDGTGNPVALANLYRAHPDVTGIYVADLDAIAGGSLQPLGHIANVGLPLLVDAGTTTVERAQSVAAVTPNIVIGLETLASFDDLQALIQHFGADRIVFSLDLRAGTPVSRFSAGPAPMDVARQAVMSGVRRVIVLDMARVGKSTGTDLMLVEQMRQLVRGELLVGGGIRGSNDLRQLAARGVDGALVATAIISGEGEIDGTVSGTGSRDARGNDESDTGGRAGTDQRMHP